ncbi:ATP-binding protein [Sporomusa sphaeroides]|uniref:ATP-binding protein n=1 Tax=Sporomusa sphaeroides TaxID=47679 RepID=UPI002C206F1B|nr:ATP-binding protein [Sporomusa sphaeroides]HML31959.1 ATP-binding protein [Sporomusa sphaeroides]
MPKEEIEYGSILLGRQIKAQYVETEDEMFLHNPYIEALPELKLDELHKMIGRFPNYNDDLRQHTAHKRLDYVLRIGWWVQPMPAHIILAQRIMRFIKQGYMPKNPLTAEWVKQISAAFSECEVDEGQVGCFLRPIASGMAFIGPSGIGKTLTMETVLSLIPQVIFHNQYNGQAFDRAQIVWLKVDAAKDGSAKGLCRSMFHAIDRLLGTNYYKQYFKYSAKDAVEVLTRLSWVLGLGLLVVDEIQRLNLAASGGEKELINFFSCLQKTLNIPVILIGTYSAMNLFKDEFSCARPLCSQGDFIWDKYLKGDEAWDYFIDSLWKYQFTNCATSLSKTLRTVIYQESQGITDIAVKLYMLAQWEVIGSRNEKITPKLINIVADRHLNLVRPMLAALRTGDIERIREIKDLYSPIQDDALNQSFRRAQEKVFLKEKAQQIVSMKQEINIDTQLRPVDEVAGLLVECGFDKELAWCAANDAVDQSPSKSSITVLKQTAFSFALALKNQIINKDEVKLETEGLPGTVIRECKGNETDTSYDEIKNKGLAADLTQLFGT